MSDALLAALTPGAFCLALVLMGFAWIAPKSKKEEK